MNGTPIHGLRTTPALAPADLAWVVLLLLAGAALRLPGLNEGLWLDEITTLTDHVLVPAEAIVSNYDSRNNHILYSLLAHFSVGQFGASAWALRLPAVLFGIATIPAAWYLGRQLGSRHEALLATAFLTLSYHHVWFSQNARGYSGLLLGCVLSSIFFVRLLALRRPGKGTVVAYAVIAALTCWIHLVGAVMVLAHSMIWLAVTAAMRGKEDRNLHSGFLFALLLAGLFTLLLYLPLLNSVFVQIAVVREVLPTPASWQSPDWVVRELWHGAIRAVPGGWPLALMAWLTLAMGVMAYAKQGLVPVAILTLPVGVITLVVTALSAVFFPRFLFGFVVFFLLLGVRGGFVLSRAILPGLNDRHILAAGFVVALATGLMVPDAWKPKQDFIAAAEFVNAHRKPGDAVVCFDSLAKPFQQYLDMDCQSPRSVDELSKLERAHSRTWFIYAFPILFENQLPQVWSKVRTDYTMIKSIDGTIVGGDIVIMLSSGNEVQ